VGFSVGTVDCSSVSLILPPSNVCKSRSHGTAREATLPQLHHGGFQKLVRPPTDDGCMERAGRRARRGTPSSGFGRPVQVPAARRSLACARAPSSNVSIISHVSSGFSRVSQDLAMWGEEHGGSGRDRTGPRPTAGLHPRQGRVGCLCPPCRPTLPHQRDLAGRCRRAAAVTAAQ
jgi:hypothetical protein